jgi:FAD:protein FMN transferase
MVGKPRLSARHRTSTDHLVARHKAYAMGTNFAFSLVAPAGMGRADVSGALAAAVAELRVIDAMFSPHRPGSLVAQVRRGELAPEAFPAPLADVVLRCTRMRAMTDGWFDAWAMPGGFDPSGLVKGWALEFAGRLLRSAGIDEYAITGGGDTLVRGYGPDGEPWSVPVRDPVDPSTATLMLSLSDGAVASSGTGLRGSLVIDPHTGEQVRRAGPVTVVGPDPATADGYATALYAAGPAGAAWLPNHGDYRAFTVSDRTSTADTPGQRRGSDQQRLLAPT